MSKTPSKTMENPNDELLPEYRFDYAQAKPNRFAHQTESQTQRTVVLDEDVAQVFTTPESVNKVLRALIASMPKSVVDGESAQISR